jgi:nucleoside-diphosphate-sugar epimerase
MRALVTGGGGFLGGALVRRLSRLGWELRSLSRSDYPELMQLGAEQVRGDLADPGAVDRAVADCEVVFHVAAKAAMWGRYQEFYATNVIGTSNVIDSCRKHGVQKLVYTSTPAVVHAGGDIEGADESLPYAERYHAHYPATKAQAERAVLAANSPGLSTVALRPHLIWGPGDTQLVPRVVDRARRGVFRFVGDGSNRVDSVYIDNAVDAHLNAFERLTPDSPCAGGVYFISNGEPMRMDELINGILAAAGLPPENRSVPLWLAWTVGALIEGVHTVFQLSGEPGMTRSIASHLATSHYYDISAARRDLGYQPLVTIAEGLDRLAEWLAAESD